MKSALSINPFRPIRIIALLFTLSLVLPAPVFAQVSGTDEKVKLQQFEDAITRGEQFLSAKEYAKAKAEYQKALSIDPAAKYPKDKLAYIRKFYIDPEDEKKFSQAMENGNRFMGINDFQAARQQFEAAVNLKPEDKSARDKLAEADRQHTARQEAQKQYNILIADADRLYASGDLANARPVYESALRVDPAADYPKKKIREIDTRISADKALKESYEKALAEGDEAYMNRDFETARLKYEQALKIKPGENYPKSMLERVSQGSVQLKETQKNYQAAVAAADQLFNAKEYEKALIEYQNAQRLLPAEVYPSQQTEKINAVLLQKQQLDEAYAKAVSDGDKYLSEKKYMEARSEFQNANNLKPAEAYPRQKIEEIAGLLLALKEAERAKAYNEAASEADLLFDAGNYDQALIRYQEASTVKPDEAHPKNRIAAINKLNEDAKAARLAYDKAIADADQKFGNAAFEEAIAQYQVALAIKQDEAYPGQQISKAREQIEAIRIKEEAYKQAVGSADKLLADNDLEGALSAYRQALEIKAGSAYPAAQMQKVNEMLSANRSRDEQYQQLIADADRLYKLGSYPESLAAYRKSLELKPLEKYPSDQVAVINQKLENILAQKQAYDQAVEEADQLFKAGDYQKAREKYAAALLIMPDEKYPREKTDAIDAILLQMKSLEENYAGNLKEGDDFFRTGNYQNAIIAYGNALTLKPSEQYPQNQIALATRKLEEIKAQEDAYGKKIAEADAAFNSADFTTAIGLYESALTIKPAGEYPTLQIKKANENLKALEMVEESYKSAIAAGDQSLGEGNFESALASYRQAVLLKKTATYPQEQIDKINNLLTAKRSKDEQYQKLIADADRYFASGSLDEASEGYTRAGELKPEENHPVDQLKAIAGMKEAQQAKQKAYQQLISAADGFLNAGDYEKALNRYKEAGLIFPDEKYPREKIASIEGIQEQRKSLEENYAKNISGGDQAFRANEYEKSASFYEQARALKPEETYAPEKLAQIAKILQQQKAVNEQYQQIVADADKLFGSGQLDAAATKYKEARDLRPLETYPEEQIGIINNLIGKRKETEQLYRSLIAEADRLFAANEDDRALEKYREALLSKPSEAYPAEQITRISDRKAEYDRIHRTYATWISKGDSLYSLGEGEEAIGAYRNALNVKPSETYPSERIAAIGREITDKKSTDDKYRAAIEEADRYFGGKDYQNALVSYRNALVLKPDEQHPRQRLTETESLLEAQKQAENKEYNDAVESGNRLFTLQDYTSAVKAYEKASALRPGEAYPRNKLIEINTILMERVRNQMDAYNKVISKADLAYQDKIFDQAIDAYEEAALIRPEEGYPGEMIRKIRQYMIDHAMVDLVTAPLIIKADTERKFAFSAIEMRLRKNNYIILKARKTGETEPKVYLNYGINGQKSGGIVLRSIKSQETADYMVRVSVQDRWYRLDNNWISIYSEGGEVEVSSMQISQGD